MTRQAIVVSCIEAGSDGLIFQMDIDTIGIAMNAGKNACASLLAGKESLEKMGWRCRGVNDRFDRFCFAKVTDRDSVLLDSRQ